MFKTAFLILLPLFSVAAYAHETDNTHAIEHVDEYIVGARDLLDTIQKAEDLGPITTKAQELLTVAMPLLDYGATHFPECAVLAKATKEGLSQRLEQLTYDEIDTLYHQEPEDEAKDRCYYNRDLPIHAAFVLKLAAEKGLAARDDMAVEMTEIIPNAEKLKTHIVQ